MQKSSVRNVFWILLITLSLFVVISQSISVPISTQQYRCMVVFSSSEEQDMKIDIRFPEFKQAQNHDEYFVVWINNTESFQATFHRVQPGQTFRRQLQLQPNVMYKICFRINSTSQRKIGPVDVQYQAYHQFRITNNDRHNIKVPDSILKQNDLKNSYDDALYLLDLTQRQLYLNQQHKGDQQRHFDIMNSTTETLMLISVVEIGFICLVAVIQFFVIKKHLAGELRL